MKLWKSKKPIGGCVPGKSSALKQEQEQLPSKQHQQQQQQLHQQHHHQQQESNGIALAPMLSGKHPVPLSLHAPRVSRLPSPSPSPTPPCTLQFPTSDIFKSITPHFPHFPPPPLGYSCLCLCCCCCGCFYFLFDFPSLRVIAFPPKVRPSRCLRQNGPQVPRSFA